LAEPNYLHAGQHFTTSAANPGTQMA